MALSLKPDKEKIIDSQEYCKNFNLLANNPLALSKSNKS